MFLVTFEVHASTLQAVLIQLQQHWLKLKAPNCNFEDGVKYLRHKVSAQGVETDTDKLAAVKSWPEPVNVKTYTCYKIFCQRLCQYS